MLSGSCIPRSAMLLLGFFLPPLWAAGMGFQRDSVANGEETMFDDECPKYSFEALLVELRQEYPGARWLAADCLEERKDARAVEPLVQAILREDFPRLKMIEANALKALDDPQSESLLLDALHDKTTEQSAIYALGQLHSKRAVSPLIQILKKSDRFTSAFAADALAEIKDSRALQPLCVVLKGKDTVLRRYAAINLGQLGDPNAIRALVSALNDRDAGVRENVAEALGRLHATSAVDPLIRTLSDKDETARVNAVDSLADIGDDRAVPAIIRLMRSGTGRDMWHGAAALVKFNTTQATAALDSALEKPELRVVAAAYRYFLSRNDPQSIDALIAAMPDHGWYEMADALRASGNPRLIDAAREWERNNGHNEEP